MQVDGWIGWWLIAALAGGWLLYLLAPVLTPFLAAALLAYLGDPLADRLQRLGLRRGIAVGVVFALLIGVLLALLMILVPLLQGQLGTLLRRLPDYLDLFDQRLLPWLSSHLDIDLQQYNLLSLKQALAQHVDKLGTLANGFWLALSSSSTTLLAVLANLVLIPVLTFYLLRDWDALMAGLQRLLPRRYAPVICSLAREADDALGAFLKGQLLVMLGLATVYAVGLVLVGLDFALLIGLLAGLVSFVPYLGLIIGLLSAGIAALVQFQTASALLPVLVVFGIGQALETAVLTPLLVGDRLGLHPVVVIFAVLAGGQLFGFFGILLALPTAAVLMVLVRRSHRHYLASEFYRADSGGRSA